MYQEGTWQVGTRFIAYKAEVQNKKLVCTGFIAYKLESQLRKFNIAGWCNGSTVDC